MIPQHEQPAKIFDFTQYIKQTPAAAQYKCDICYEKMSTILVCKKCKKLFCIQCLNSICQKKYECPFRCSDNFIVQRLNSAYITYQCPNSECKCEFLSIQTFENHMENCEKNSKLVRDMFNYRKSYKCLKGQHNLQFLVGTFNQLCKDYLCDLCKNNQLCRSICRKCNQKFCVKCRPVPCSKKLCPIGHIFKKYYSVSKAYTCDICCASVIIAGNYVYDDKQCNFGVCIFCWEKLPEENQIKVAKPPFFQYCQNVSDQKQEESKQKHKLNYVGSNNFQKCKICQEYKKCYLTCNECKQFYCSFCKAFMLKSRQICKFGHKISKQTIQIKQQNQQMNQINYIQYKCDKCLRNATNILYVDQICGVSLCQDCLNYIDKIQSQKQRNIYTGYCLKNHSLCFYSQGIYLTACSVCKQQKCVKFFCMICLTNRYYCGQCRTFLKNKIDCLQHTPVLMQAGDTLDKFCKDNVNQGYHCHKCNKIQNFQKMYCCVRCQYGICQPCFNES